MKENNINFVDRYERLDKILSEVKTNKSFPLLREIRLSKELFDEVCAACSYYLYTSIVAAGNGTYLKKSPANYYYHHVAKLPNKTPNGLILPKQQNFLAYNALHQTVVKIIEKYGIAKHIRSIHAPINIRYVESKPDEIIDNRPYASTKWHSDLFNGEPSNTIMVFIPISGNLVQNGIHFAEPDPNEFMSTAHVLDDYDKCQWLLNNAKKYDINLDTDYLYLTDPYLLHKTCKGGMIGRLSLDFRFTTNYVCHTDVEIASLRQENYISYKDWASIGKTKILYSNLSLDEVYESRPGEYASKYKLVDL